MSTPIPTFLNKGQIEALTSQALGFCETFATKMRERSEVTASTENVETKIGSAIALQEEARISLQQAKEAHVQLKALYSHVEKNLGKFVGEGGRDGKWVYSDPAIEQYQSFLEQQISALSKKISTAERAHPLPAKRGDMTLPNVEEMRSKANDGLELARQNLEAKQKPSEGDIARSLEIQGNINSGLDTARMALSQMEARHKFISDNIGRFEGEGGRTGGTVYPSQDIERAQLELLKQIADLRADISELGKVDKGEEKLDAVRLRTIPAAQAPTIEALEVAGAAQMPEATTAPVSVATQSVKAQDAFQAYAKAVRAKINGDATFGRDSFAISIVVANKNIKDPLILTAELDKEALPRVMAKLGEGGVEGYVAKHEDLKELKLAAEEAQAALDAALKGETLVEAAVETPTTAPERGEQVNLPEVAVASTPTPVVNESESENDDDDDLSLVAERVVEQRAEQTAALVPEQQEMEQAPPPPPPVQSPTPIVEVQGRTLEAPEALNILMMADQSLADIYQAIADASDPNTGDAVKLKDAVQKLNVLPLQAELEDLQTRVADDPSLQARIDELTDTLIPAAKSTPPTPEQISEAQLDAPAFLDMREQTRYNFEGHYARNKLVETAEGKIVPADGSTFEVWHAKLEILTRSPDETEARRSDTDPNSMTLRQRIIERIYARLPARPRLSWDDLLKIRAKAWNAMGNFAVRRINGLFYVRAINALTRDKDGYQVDDDTLKTRLKAAAADRKSPLFGGPGGVGKLTRMQIRHMNPRLFKQMYEKSQVSNLKAKHFNSDWSDRLGLHKLGFKGSAFSTDILKLLPVASIGLINENEFRKIRSWRIGDMDKDRVEAISDKQTNKMRSAQLIALGDKIQHLSHLAKVSGAALRKLDRATFEKFITAVQTKGVKLTADQLNNLYIGYKDIGYTSQVKLIKPASLLANMDPKEVVKLKPRFLRALSNEQLTELAKVRAVDATNTPTTDMALTVDQINSLKQGPRLWNPLYRNAEKAQIRAIPAADLAKAVAKAKAEGKPGLTPAQVSGMDKAQLLAIGLDKLTEKQLQAIPSKMITELAQDPASNLAAHIGNLRGFQLAAILPGTPGFDDKAIAKRRYDLLIRTQMRRSIYYGLTVYRINSMNQAGVEAAAKQTGSPLHPNNLAKMPTWRSAYIKDEIYNMMDKDQIGALKSWHFNPSLSDKMGLRRFYFSGSRWSKNILKYTPADPASGKPAKGIPPEKIEFIDAKVFGKIAAWRVGEMSIDQIKKITDKQMPEMNQYQLAAWNAEKTKSIPPALISKISEAAMPGLKINELDDAQLKGIKVQQLNGLDPGRWYPPRKAPQIQSLTPPEKIAKIFAEIKTVEDFQQIKPHVFAGMTPEQFIKIATQELTDKNGKKFTLIEAMTGDQVRAIPPGAFALMEKADLDKISVTQIGVMTRKQLMALEKVATKPEQLEAIAKYKFKYRLALSMRDWARWAVGVYKINRMNENDVKLAESNTNSPLHPNKIGQMSAWKFSFIRTEVCQYLTPKQVAGIKPHQYNSYFSNILAKMKPEQIGTIPPTKDKPENVFGKIHSKRLAKLGVEQKIVNGRKVSVYPSPNTYIANITKGQMQVANKYQLNRLGKNKRIGSLQSLTPSAVSGINPEVLRNVDWKTIKNFSTKQVAEGITAAQINRLYRGKGYIYGARVQALDAKGLAEFCEKRPDEFQKIDPKQIKLLTKDQTAGLTLNNLTAEQRSKVNLAYVTAEQLSKVTAEKMVDFKYKQLKKLTSAQIFHNGQCVLTAAHLDALAGKTAKVGIKGKLGVIFSERPLIQAIRPEVFAKIPVDVLKACKRETLGKVSPKQCAKMTPDQAKLMPTDLLNFRHYNAMAKTDEGKLAFLAFSPDQLAAIHPNNIRNMKVTEIFKPSQLPALKKDQVAKITRKEIGKMSAEFIAGFTEPQLKEQMTPRQAYNLLKRLEKLEKEGDPKLNMLTPQKRAAIEERASQYRYFKNTRAVASAVATAAVAVPKAVLVTAPIAVAKAIYAPKTTIKRLTAAKVAPDPNSLNKPNELLVDKVFKGNPKIKSSSDLARIAAELPAGLSLENAERLLKMQKSRDGVVVHGYMKAVDPQECVKDAADGYNKMVAAANKYGQANPPQDRVIRVLEFLAKPENKSLQPDRVAKVMQQLGLWDPRMPFDSVAEGVIKKAYQDDIKQATLPTRPTAELPGLAANNARTAEAAAEAVRREQEQRAASRTTSNAPRMTT